MEGIIPTGSPEGDRTALLALYRATHGKTWRRAWDINGDMSKWDGVTVNGEGRVVRLVLISNNLRGTIPPELGKLSVLQRIILSRNQLGGTIPCELGRLTALEYLWLNNNNLTGPIPAALANLRRLHDIFLADNDLDGPLPTHEEFRQLQDALHGASRLYGESSRSAGAVEPTVSSKVNIVSSTASTVKMSSMGSTPTSGFLHAKRSSVMSMSPVLDEEASEGEALGGRSRLKGVSGAVVAWSLGPGPAIVGVPDFELDIPDVSGPIPALVCMSTSLAQLNGKSYLLHPVVTCLAGVDVKFPSPLTLRFPIGDTDSIASGSDCETSPPRDEADYRRHLRKEFSMWVQEEGVSHWTTHEGDIVEKEGVFFLEISVPHFTRWALAREVERSDSGVATCEIKRLRHKSRARVFLFVSEWDEPVTVIYGYTPNPVKTSSSSAVKVLTTGLSLLRSWGARPVTETALANLSLPACGPGQQSVSDARTLPTKSAKVAWVTECSRLREESIGRSRWFRWRAQQDVPRRIKVWDSISASHKTAIILQKERASIPHYLGMIECKNNESLDTAVARYLEWKMQTAETLSDVLT